jgi:hypothetical protein
MADDGAGDDCMDPYADDNNGKDPYTNDDDGKDPSADNGNGMNPYADNDGMIYADDSDGMDPAQDPDSALSHGIVCRHLCSDNLYAEYGFAGRCTNPCTGIQPVPWHLESHHPPYRCLRMQMQICV